MNDRVNPPRIDPEEKSVIDEWPDEEAFFLSVTNMADDEDGNTFVTNQVTAKIGIGDPPIKLPFTARAYNWFVRNVIWRIK